MTRTNALLAGGAAIILGAAGIAAATAEDPSAGNHAEPNPLITVEGTFKPGQELAVYANCETGTRATLTTSFGAEEVMSPAADSARLLGFFTAPDNIGPGPDEGYHTVTVECEAGNSATIRIPSGGNGFSMTPEDK